MSYRDVNLHLVWATKGRRRYLSADRMEPLARYLAGAVRNMDGEVYAINGPDDHVHLALALPPSISLADFVRELKSNSSRWMKEQGNNTFAWQPTVGLRPRLCLSGPCGAYGTETILPNHKLPSHNARHV